MAGNPAAVRERRDGAGVASGWMLAQGLLLAAVALAVAVAAVVVFGVIPPVREVAAWAGERNAHATRIDWRFTTADARIKLRRLYPSLGGTPPATTGQSRC